MKAKTEPLSAGQDLRQVRTIQRTSKPLKLQMLIASLLLIGGMIGIVLGANAEALELSDSATGGLVLASVLALVIGLPWVIVAKVLAWWHHG